MALDTPKRFNASGTIRAFAFGLVVAAALPSCRSEEHTVKGTIRFADVANVDVRDVPLLMAIDTLVAEGIRVETTYLTNGTLVVDALARGELDIGMSNVQTAWSAIARGADLRTVVEATAPSNLLAASEHIRSCGDLHNRPFGVANTSGFSPLLQQLYFDRRCPGTEPQTIVLPEARARAAALVAGRVDATMMPADDFYRIRHESGRPFHVLMSHAAEFPEVKIDALHVRTEWAREHPQLLRAFIGAQLKAHRLVVSRPDVLYEEAARRLSLDPALARVIADAHLEAGIWGVNGGLTVDALQVTLQFLKKADALPPGLAVDRVSDLSHLHAVLDELGRVP